MQYSKLPLRNYCALIDYASLELTMSIAFLLYGSDQVAKAREFNAQAFTGLLQI